MWPDVGMVPSGTSVWSGLRTLQSCSLVEMRRDMPTIIAYHDVKDTEHWLASPKREEFFGRLGITNIRTLDNPQQPTKVGILLAVPDLNALMSAVQAQEGADAMPPDGVVPETLVILVEQQAS